MLDDVDLLSTGFDKSVVPSGDLLSGQSICFLKLSDEFFRRLNGMFLSRGFRLSFSELYHSLFLLGRDLSVGKAFGRLEILGKF